MGIPILNQKPQKEKVELAKRWNEKCETHIWAASGDHCYKHKLLQISTDGMQYLRTLSISWLINLSTLSYSG